MSNLSIEGKVKRILDEQVISERFKKREFVIETEEQYPQVLVFQLAQDKTNLIDPLSVGDKVEVYELVQVFLTSSQKFYPYHNQYLIFVNFY